MNEVGSLIDKDTVVIQATHAMTDIILSKYEKELSEKLNKKVIVVPFGLKLYSIYSTDPVKEINKESFIDKLRTRKLTAIEQAAEEIRLIVDKTPKYKLLNKEEYINLKIDSAKKIHEDQWDRLSKGHKYVVYTEDENKSINYYSLDYFYDTPILGCNISK